MIPLDPDTPVVHLCTQGMEAEARHDYAEASRLFAAAWDARTSPADACVAAHFVARHQPSADGALYWNERALAEAQDAPEQDVLPFFASLYLNVAHSHELLGHRHKATMYYTLAEEYLPAVAPGPYRDVVEDGIRRGLERLSAS